MPPNEHDDEGNGRLLARLDERSEWTVKVLEGIQQKMGQGDARMDKWMTGYKIKTIESTDTIEYYLYKEKRDGR